MGGGEGLCGGGVEDLGGGGGGGEVEEEALKNKYDIEEVGEQKNDFSSYVKYHIVDERSNIQTINGVKSLLCNNLDMKDHEILGIKITRSVQGIVLDQSYYVEKILKKCKYFDCKLACTPYDPSVKLFKNAGESVRQTEYASIIGSLRYATDCTRPDIAYVVGLLCIFTSSLKAYNDEDWNTLSDDSKSTRGYIFSIAGGVISWKLKKQTILARSTMESEVIALATTSEEVSWLRCLLAEIPL
ncbi:uncharacterized mitochondrial protein AtMg00810-like [Vicia villosa]|uniref:uncharacterized mitochondrial protein AtMg00810-like n=1 Tax=Vicia villosa TaxID=3911 RepID=UPI00273B840B|nr:uncharacterized mitochondrial protein AtMg00810-like [Vicia villosa]